MKKILLAITGSIAAVKTYDLIRELKEKEFDVQCIVTSGGEKFISRLALESLTGFRVLGPNIFTFQIPEDPREKISNELYAHIEITKDIDAFIIAPLSADTLADITHAKADDFLCACLLTNTVPVFFAPAMNTKMWASSGVQANIITLKKRGYICIPPQTKGILACGDEGMGKMAIVTDIVFEIERYFTPNIYHNKKILINTGGTREMIDSVRCITNLASGKTGKILSSTMQKMGGNVFLVKGGKSNQEMYSEMDIYFDESDIIIFSAAASDFVIANDQLLMTNGKIKKEDHQNLILKLEPNLDIACEFAKKKKKNQIFVGFALETGNIEELKKSMIHKSNKKKFDIVIGNFSENIGSDISEYLVYMKNENIWESFTGSKKECLENILIFIAGGVE